MIGFHVRCRPVSLLIQPESASVSEYVGKFFDQLGLNNAEAIVVPIGSTTGGPGLMDSIGPLAKLAGLLGTVVKQVLAWRTRAATITRRRMRPPVIVTILADHVPLRRQTADTHHDTASLIVGLLPDLLGGLQTAYPSFNISIYVRAKGLKIDRVDVQVGNGLELTDQHALRILKWLGIATNSITVRHRENWLSFPTVKLIKGRSFTARQFSGSAMMGPG
ncbi:hypothetical protein [Paenarthrobacter sp. NPDC057981]|uniref:hypothetical protein n=1 Tax=Paenarthrobacter sp. NPDC057981 TaxID=3346297 RepID=UPI0036DBDA48